MLSTYASHQLVFIDKSNKDGWTLVQLSGCPPVGEQAVESMTHKCGKCWSIIPTLTTDGYIALHAISGSVNGEDFFEFDKNYNRALPKMGQFPQCNSVLVMDNASIHKSKALCQVVEEAGSFN
ncbi:hypothetical protein PAXRUDRAFT_149133 [Paxillus rubicundulus Ve08.2h10]|uniref:Tc1-like transposase DDE domain-containing protein n=1 Tax=Paxillus rubicundulus Ve08.2h10 TaxID=930991 RepID=A0A0D0DT42_9AGAM|nr:hypothetical protein PAXRUDRAFT_149133 [Paxillus rubicundulus Ve08.2h10]